MKSVTLRVWWPEDCPVCGYSREGLETGSPCPECGFATWPGAPVFRVIHLARGEIVALAVAIPFCLLCAVGFVAAAEVGGALWFFGTAVVVLLSVWTRVRCGVYSLWLLAPEGILEVRDRVMVTRIPWPFVGRVRHDWWTGKVSIRNAVPGVIPRKFVCLGPRRHTLRSGRISKAFVEAVETVRRQVEESGLFMQEAATGEETPSSGQAATTAPAGRLQEECRS